MIEMSEWFFTLQGYSISYILIVMNSLCIWWWGYRIRKRRQCVYRIRNSIFCNWTFFRI